MAIVEYLPKQIHEFQIELDQHPDLQFQINTCVDFADKISTLALALNLVLDGSYHSWEITNILEELTRRMRKRREIVVLESVAGTALRLVDETKEKSDE